ncbi:MAG: hypothetical protein OXI16_02535 [Chloroflexota bacterium]|nr:hypothetical protein [Chloroflexota bacterium]
MIDTTVVITIIGFLGVISTVSGLLFWFDARNRAEMREIRTDMRDMRTEMRHMQAQIQVLSSKIDRAQGNLDVLVFGERGVPVPVERERSQLESRAEEPVGD